MSPDAELAVDQLWKYQLRREHTALLEEMQVRNNAFAAFAEEAKAAHQQLQEQITALKSKCDKLADDNERCAQKLKDNLRDVQERSAEVGGIRDELRAMAARVEAMDGTGNKVADTTPLAAEPNTNESTKLPITAVTRQASPPPAGYDEANKKPSLNVANTGLRKSRRQARQEPSPVLPRTYAKLGTALLNQDGVSIGVFVRRVDEISATIPPADQRPLAASFITGLDQRKEQDAIVKELSKKGLAKVHENGQVEVKCDWKDLKTAVTRAGLMSCEQEESLPKRRKK